MAKYKFLLPVLMLALVVSTIAGMLGTVAASPANSPAAAVANIPDSGNTNANVSQQAAKPDPNKVVEGVRCGDVSKFGYDKQVNIRAGLIMAGCGLTPAASGSTLPHTSGNMALPANYGGTDQDVILPDGTSPHVTQSEAMVWGHNNTIVVNYNDSRTAPSCYSGASYSTDGGTTWQHNGQPFCSGHGTNYGDPIVVWNNALNLWFAGDLATGCGGQGIGMWTSPDGVTWTAGACAHNGASDDRQSMWVDNNAASPHYGRMYISWNNFALSQQIQVTYSDNGTTWSTPVNVTTSFIRNVQDTGDLAGSGTVFIAAMDEGGGGPANRTNHMYRSTDGGATWTNSTMGAPFPPAGRSTCGYFTCMYPNYWRHMGWGQPAAVGNVVHYTFAQGTAPNYSGDPGNIMYTRSTDNGTTWSAPIMLNTDGLPTRAQFQPSLAATVGGAVYVGWYDERETTGVCSPGANAPCYRRFGRVSLDNGATWQADMAVGDVISPLPAQPDSAVQPTYAGDYNYDSSDGTNIYDTWTDGRVLIGGTSQQDVFFDKINGTVGTPTPTVTGTPPTATPTRTPTVTPTRTNTSTPLPCGSIRILIAYADLGGPPTTLQAALLAEPGVAAVDLFDAASGTPTLSLLQQYNEVLTFTNNTYADPTGMGNVIADYQDSGGVVVVATFAFYNGFNISGRWITGGYSPFNLSSTANFSNASLGSYIVGHPLMNGVTSLTAFYRVGVTTAAGATQVATYTDNLPLASVKTTNGHTAVGINAYLGQNPQNFSGDWGKLIANAARWLIVCGTPTSTVTPGGPTNTPLPPTPTATPTQCGTSAAWTAGPNLPTPLIRAVGVFFPANGKFYTMGGRTSDSAGSDVLTPYEYTPGNPGTWAIKAAMYNNNQVNNQACGVLTVSGTPYIFCVGGSAATQTTATAQVRRYNPATDTLTQMVGDDWPGDTSGTILPGGFAVVNNKLYILGGFDINTASTNQIWEYDPNATGSHWTQKVNAPAGLMYAPAAAINNIIYVGGASDYQGGTVVDTSLSFSYNPATNTTGAIATIPRATGETRAVVVNNKMWVLGGGRVSPNPSNQVDVYDPVANMWSTGLNFMNARRNFPADSDPATSRVWLAGGYEPSTAAQDMEIYRPATTCASPTPAPPTATATNTPVPPTATRTVTPVPPTSTATNTPAPTNTPGGPTNTRVPTNTPAPTNTPGGPTNTAVPTNTPGGPTNTPMASATPTDCPNPFVDINGNVFYTAIHYLYCRGVVNGTDPTHYTPAGTSTRAQFAKVVVLGFMLPSYTPSGGTQDFTDVPNTYWAYSYIEAGFHAGILNGFDAANCTSHGATYPCYLPNLAITRGQLTKLVVLAGQCPFYTPTSGQTFSDVPRSNVFFAFIETAYHDGVINGYPDGTFRPNLNIRRDEMAQIVYEGILHCPGFVTTTPVPATNTPAPATNTPAATRTPGMAAVSIIDDAFQPQTITVTLGTMVMWTHNGTHTHTVTADDSSWTSGNLHNGDTYSHTFTTVGTFGYHCQIHGGPGTGMYGTVIVMPMARLDGQ